MTIEHSNPTDLSPPPTGVYSHLVAAAGKQLFIAGQLPRDKAGKLVGHNDIAAQYRQAWANMLTALRAAGLGPEHLVHVRRWRKQPVWHPYRAARVSASQPTGHHDGGGCGTRPTRCAD